MLLECIRDLEGTVVLDLDSELFLLQAAGALPAVLGSPAVQRVKRFVERIPGAHRVYKWVTTRTGEGHVYEIPSGPLAGLKWRRYNSFPYWYHLGVYEPDVSHCIVNHLKEGDTFWDIGAHAGYHTLLGARAVGPGGSVLAVEPDPEVCEIMHGQLELNDIGNTAIVCAAVAAEPGETTFLVQGHDNRTSALADVHGSAQAHAHSRPTVVDCTTLELLAEQAPAPALLKMDVEGAEAIILPAAGRYFSGPHRPRVMILGYHGVPTGNKCVEWMREYGYRVVPAPGLVTEVGPHNGTMLWYDHSKLN